MTLPSFLLAATELQAELTAEIDWKWERIDRTRWRRPITGDIVHRAIGDDWFRGQPHGTRVFLAFDAREARCWPVVERLIFEGRLHLIAEQVKWHRRAPGVLQKDRQHLREKHKVRP